MEGSNLCVFLFLFGIIFLERSDFMKYQVLSAAKIVLITFVFSAIIMFLMRRVAIHIGALDIPRSDEENRHIHKKTTELFHTEQIIRIILQTAEVLVLKFRRTPIK